MGFCELSQDVTMIVADSLANKEELRKIDLNGMTLAASITLSCLLFVGILHTFTVYIYTQIPLVSVRSNPLN